MHVELETIKSSSCFEPARLREVSSDSKKESHKALVSYYIHQLTEFFKKTEADSKKHREEFKKAIEGKL